MSPPASRPSPTKRSGLVSAYTVFMSLKYLRHRHVNVISVVCVALSVAILIVVLAVMGGFQTAIRAAFQETTSHLVCVKWRGGAIRFPEEYVELEKTIRAQAHVVGVAPRVRVMAAVALPNNPIGMWLQIFGIDPERDVTATQLRKHLQQVRHSSLRVDDVTKPFTVQLSSDERPRPGILLGERTMQDLELMRGQTIAIAAARMDSDRSKPIEERFHPRELVCVTAGAYTSGTFDFDRNTAFLPLDVVLSDFMEAEGAPIEIYVKLDDYDANAASAREALLAALPLGWSVRTWEELNATYLGAVDTEKRILGYILSLLIVLAGGSILAILTMMVIEKTRDIGILKSIGGTIRGIAAIFVMNGLAIGVVGSLMGLLLGLLVTLIVNWIDTRIVAPIVGQRVFREDIYVFRDIPTHVEPALIGTIVVAAIVVSLLASLIPAWKAARLHAVESLRYE